MHLVLSKEWTVNCSPFFKAEVYDSLKTIVRWTPLTGSGLRIKMHHVTLRTKHYQHRGTLWHAKTQIKSIEHKKPCRLMVRLGPFWQLLRAPNGTKAALISWVIPHVLNNATLWGIIKMQILFQLSLCILLFFPFSCTTTYSYPSIIRYQCSGPKQRLWKIDPSMRLHINNVNTCGRAPNQV